MACRNGFRIVREQRGMMRTRTSFVGMIVALAASTSLPAADKDFGQTVENLLAARSKQLFGVGKPLEHSSSESITQQQAQADPLLLVTLAGGLSATVVTAGTAGSNLDQIALWPDDENPTWLIVCNEGGTSDPGLQRIEIATGNVATMLKGTTSCDGVR